MVRHPLWLPQRISKKGQLERKYPSKWLPRQATLLAILVIPRVADATASSTHAQPGLNPTAKINRRCRDDDPQIEVWHRDPRIRRLESSDRKNRQDKPTGQRYSFREVSKAKR